MEIRTIKPFLKYFDSVRERTMRVTRLIPPDKLDWTCSPGKFTLGDLPRHLAVVEHYLWAENIQGKPSRYTSHGKELADGLDNIVTFMERTHAESMEIFGRLTDDDLARNCTTIAGTEVPIRLCLRAMVEHEIHHRGQMYLYLGMLGIPTPPLFGLTSEEVRARSAGSP
jgi:uncharacterized damage-inducible protein DinB